MRTIKPLQQLGTNTLTTLIVGALVIFIGLFIVSNYVNEPDFQEKQITFSVILLGAMLISFFTVLLPGYKNVRKAFKELISSEERAIAMTGQLTKLYDELGRSYQDLEAVNHISEEPSVFVKSDAKGNPIVTYDHFKDIMGIGSSDFDTNIFEWLKESSTEKGIVDKLDIIVSEGKSWNGQINIENLDGDFIWLDLVLQPVPSANPKEKNILLIGRDVTEVKEARQRSREINKDLIDKRVKEQQYRSALILEGQEEERKRIAQEIHDGIGQMLTGLKLNLEGITPSSAPHMRQRISDTKHIMKSVIKEVRRVSFNLSPSSLVDFGIVPAMKKISQEVSSLTSTNVTFENITGYINRLDSNVETNLYRIVQEAVNNGIKYAKAETIVISFEHDPTKLVVKITDNGAGFELKKLENAGHFGASGHGIFNMKERASYINAKFDVETELGKGTVIIITVPLT
ncbi:MAG: histidine kinase [Reichenbachiella sp.]